MFTTRQYLAHAGSLPSVEELLNGLASTSRCVRSLGPLLAGFSASSEVAALAEKLDEAVGRARRFRDKCAVAGCGDYDVGSEHALVMLFLQRALFRVEVHVGRAVKGLQEAAQMVKGKNELDVGAIVSVIIKSVDSADPVIRTAMKSNGLWGPKNSELTKKRVKSLNDARRAFAHCGVEPPPERAIVCEYLDATAFLLAAFASTPAGPDPDTAAVAAACGESAARTASEAACLRSLDGAKTRPRAPSIAPTTTALHAMRVPFKAVPTFTGRESLIDAAVTNLVARAPVVLHGAPGVGKSVTAIEVVKRIERAGLCGLHRWVQADSAEAVRAELERFGRSAVPGVAESDDEGIVLGKVARFLTDPSRSGEWLFVCDDLSAEAVDELERVVPSFFTLGRVLATTSAVDALPPLPGLVALEVGCKKIDLSN